MHVLVYFAAWLIVPYQAYAVSVSDNDDSCDQIYIVKAGDSCESIILDNRIQEKRFRRLNPNVDCKKLGFGTVLCLNNGGDGCVSYYALGKNDTNCENIAKNLGLKISTLKNLNPKLNCAKEIKVSRVCSESTNPECKETYRVKKGDSIKSIIDKFEIGMDQFNQANPYIDENAIKIGQVICIRIKSNSQMNYHFIEKLCKSNKNLSEKFDKYTARPNKKNRMIVEAEIEGLIEKEDFRKQLRKLEEDDDLKSFYKTNDLDRKKVCDMLKKKKNYKKARDCFCANKEPIAYCQSLFAKNANSLLQNSKLKNDGIFSEILENLDNMKNITRKRRASGPPCSFDYSTTTHSVSLGFECCYLMGFEFCVGIEGQIAVDNTIDLQNLDAYHTNILEESSISGYATICLPGLKEILEKAELSDIWDGCFVRIELIYYPFRSQLTLSFEFRYFAIVFSGGANYQISSPPSFMCSSLRCQKPYCYVYPKSFYFTGFELKFDLFLVQLKVVSFKDATPSCSNDILMENALFVKGNSITSQNDQTKLVLENNGNLVLYYGTSMSNSAIWTTGTVSGTLDSKYHLSVLSNGDVALYDGEKIKWSSRTCCNRGVPPYYLKVEDGGLLILYDSKKKSIWVAH